MKLMGNNMLGYLYLIIFFIFSCAICETSPFSFVSMGDIEPSMQNSTGIANADSLIINNQNYATWSKLANATFSISFSQYLHNIEKTEGSSKRSSDYDRFTFEDLSFAFPFGKNNFFGISYYPLSIVDMTNVFEKEAENIDAERLIRTLETRKGSISNASLIYGKAFGTLSLSSNISFKFGNYDTTTRYNVIGYEGGEEDWENTHEKRQTDQISHVSAGGGFLYGSPFGIDLGAEISVPVNSYGYRFKEFDRTDTTGRILETIYSDEYELKDIEWPMEFGLGFSYGKKHFLLSYDYRHKNFKGINTGLDETELTNYFRHTAGIKFAPGKRVYDPYYKRMSYSGIFTIEKRPFEYEENPVYDVTGSLGLDFPFNNKMTDIGLIISYTRSGSISKNGLEGNTVKFQFNFISSDNWWLKKEKYND
ncbi:MAG: hypothetical protein R6V47_07230 [Candidatus Delongbacteria bacterium]